MIGYKLLRADGSSLRERGRGWYPLTGQWAEIPGNGAYLGTTLSGLLAGGYGPLLAEMKGDGITAAVCDAGAGILTCRRVRVIRAVATTPEALVEVAIHAAARYAGAHCPAWSAWAERWLAGEDRSAEAATRAEAAVWALSPRAGAVRAAAWAAEAAVWAAEAAARETTASAREAAAWAAEAEAGAEEQQQLADLRRAVGWEEA